MKKILLVDDEEDILEFLKYNLEQENFEVLVSTNGNDALEQISQNPDLIVLDILLPEIDGLTHNKVSCAGKRSFSQSDRTYSKSKPFSSFRQADSTERTVIVDA